MASFLPHLLISLGASVAASLLLKKKPKSLQNDTPQALAQRGTYIPYLIGCRRLGSIYAYVGNRRVAKERVSGGKGSLLSPKSDVYYEQAWHLLSLPGPAARLKEIQDNGKVIFSGPITPATHPSGTTLNIGKEGSFLIYWGEPTQPINDGIQANLGLNSRWPYLASIYWNEKRLGQAPQWPILTYVFEVGLNYSLLTKSQGYKPASSWPSSLVFELHDVDPTPDRFTVRGNQLANFPPETKINVTGNVGAGADAQFTVQFSSLRDEAILGTGGIVISSTVTDIFVFESTSGYDVSGYLNPYVTGSDSGYNPAHMLAQVLFAPYPYGRGLSTADFNIDSGRGSLENLGIRLESEGLWGSIISREDGADVDEILAGILQDIGTFISLNPLTGRYDFLPIRDIGDVVPHFSDDFFLDPEPEVVTEHGARESSKIVYLFEDAEFNYRDSSVGGFDNDGEFRIVEYFRAKQVRLILPTSFEIAAKVAERRSQEDLGKGSAYTLFLNRSARLMMPGTQFTTSKTPERLICVSKKLNPLTSKVEIKAIADFVSSRESSFVNESGAPPVEVLHAESPALYGLLEVPRYLSQNRELLASPVVRAHEQILDHTIWISSDDSTYRVALQTSTVVTGGVLATSLGADSDTILESGLVEFLPKGPDLASLVMDLSGDQAGFRSGRQVLVIGNEILFVDGVEASSGKWYLGAMIRSRYGSRAASYSAGEPFFIFEPTAIDLLDEPEFIPGATIYSKAQANGSDSVPLSDVSSSSLALTGLGVSPLPPVSVAVRAAAGEVLSNSYEAGGSPEVCWSYHGFLTAATGAGLQPAGNPHGSSPLAGEFRLEFLTAGNSLQGTYYASSTSFVYSNANLVSDFGSEPSSFKVRVTHLESGYESDHTEVLVTKE